MSYLKSHFLLIDIHNTWNSATQIPISTFDYLKIAGSPDAFSGAFRRTRNRRIGISSSASSTPSIKSPEIRRPHDRSILGNGSPTVSSISALTLSSGEVSELDMFLELVPLRLRSKLFDHPEIGDLIEVVMDLGRQPLARFPSGDWSISEQPVKADDLRHAISKVGEFSADNRSGIDNSLHRISAIRNRKLQIIGLTCRVGRAISGSAEILRDLIKGGGSVLVIGPPGVGKTTLIREIARMLADEYNKRVIIIDTSNEIGGDGDVPHSGIGRARRMQVPNVNLQHNVMIEAVENHMPETIIIDEIGTELEALAASTIAQRGVQLVGTAHGMTIDNIIKNPSLQLLVGGVESVTLGDEEAKKRKVQKTILERKGPPMFTCAVEMISRTECRVHPRLDATVDAILAGKSPLFEVRCMDLEALKSLESHRTADENVPEELKPSIDEETSPNEKVQEEKRDFSPYHSKRLGANRTVGKQPVYVYTYKILEADLDQVASVMGVEGEIEATNDIGEADVILTSSSEMKQNPWIRGVAKFHQLPVYVIKWNTMAQMVKAVRMILGMDSINATLKRPPKNFDDIEMEDDAPNRKPSLEEIDALEEVRLAIEYIVIPGGEAVELLPRRSEIIARQLELVESYQLAAENSGTELNPRLQILPLKLNKKGSLTLAKNNSNLAKEIATGGVARLPLLPE